MRRREHQSTRGSGDRAGRGRGRVGVVQALLVVAQRAPARVQHLAAEAGHVDDHRGVAELVLRDQVVECQ